MSPATVTPPLLTTGPPGSLSRTALRPRGPTTTASVPDLVGRFRVGEELARGGMGVVYRAHEPSAGRDVAVKVLRDEFRGDEGMTARFLAEARITAQLQHPGVPPVFEV